MRKRTKSRAMEIFVSYPKISEARTFTNHHLSLKLWFGNVCSHLLKYGRWRRFHFSETATLELFVLCVYAKPSEASSIDLNELASIYKRITLLHCQDFKIHSFTWDQHFWWKKWFSTTKTRKSETYLPQTYHFQYFEYYIIIILGHAVLSGQCLAMISAEHWKVCRLQKSRKNLVSANLFSAHWPLTAQIRISSVLLTKFV